MPTANPEVAMQAELEMQERSIPFRRVAEAFIGAAAAGDVDALETMLSPNLARRAGPETVQRVLRGQVVPFFGAAEGLGDSVSITLTTDAFGSSGFAFFLYAVGSDGEKRPFVIYTVDEDGRIVVGNILVNHYVEGRHL